MSWDKFFKMIDVFPGYKTKILLTTMVGMGVCEMMKYHAFDPAIWTTVMAGTGLTWKMGMDRGGKKK